MSERLSVYKDNDVAKLLGSFSASDVADIFKVFKTAIFDAASALEKFSEREWLALADVFNGHLWEPNILNAGECLAASFRDADTYEDVGKKWNIDVDDVLTTLRELTYIEACSVHFAIRYHWNRCEKLPPKWWTIKARMRAE